MDAPLCVFHPLSMNGQLCLYFILWEWKPHCVYFILWGWMPHYMHIPWFLCLFACWWTPQSDFMTWRLWLVIQWAHPTSSPEFIVVCGENIILKSTASARIRIGAMNKCLFWIMHFCVITTFTELLFIFQKPLWDFTYNLNNAHKYIKYYFHNVVTETKFSYKTFPRPVAYTFNLAFLRQRHMDLLWIRGKPGLHGYTERLSQNTKTKWSKEPSPGTTQVESGEWRTEMGEAEPRDHLFTLHVTIPYRQNIYHVEILEGQLPFSNNGQVTINFLPSLTQKNHPSLDYL